MPDLSGRTPSPEPGACADPSCPVLHADPANPIHPPFYEPGGPFVDWRCPHDPTGTSPYACACEDG